MFNKKAALITTLLLAVLLVSAFSPLKEVDALYARIKAETVNGLKTALQRDIKIGRVGGILLGRIVFHDVQIAEGKSFDQGTFASAKKITINYNLVKLALTRGNIVEAITKITIYDADFLVKKEPGNNINITSIIPAGQKQDGQKPPSFHPKIVLKNCQVHYLDQAFQTKAKKINAVIDLRRKKTISITLNANLLQKEGPGKVKARGYINPKSGKYKVKLNAKNIYLAKWTNYLVTGQDLTVSRGKANLGLTIQSSPKTGPYPEIFGQLELENGQAVFQQYTLEKTSAVLAFKDNNLTIKRSQLVLNGNPMALSGQIKLAGNLNQPVVSGNLKIQKATLFGYKAGANLTFNYKNSLLKVNVKNLQAFGGNVKGECRVNLGQPIPFLKVSAQVKDIDLDKLSQRSGAVSGAVSGNIVLAGPLDDLKGKVRLISKNAQALGQDIDQAEAVFKIVDGNTLLEKISLTSEKAGLIASGSISKDLIFDLSAKAFGVKLKGKGFVGNMRAQIDSFEGTTRFKLDNAFITSPLKNLQASGSVEASHILIGEQKIDSTRGILNVGQGRFVIKELLATNNSSTITASGQTGIGVKTDLLIKGQDIQLKDLKILNLFLPAEVKDPNGQGSIALSITGIIPADTAIDSIDPLLGLNAECDLEIIDGQVAETALYQSSLKLIWQDRVLEIKSAELKMPGSDIALYAKFGPGDQLELDLNGTVDFESFGFLTKKFARVEGSGPFKLNMSGNRFNPNLDAEFNLSGFRFNDIFLDTLSGKINYSDQRLTVSSPVHFTSRENSYAITGKANFAPLNENKPEDIYLDLQLQVFEGEFSSAYSLTQAVLAEVNRRFSPEKLTAEGKRAINFSLLRLPVLSDFKSNGSLDFYRKSQKSFLPFWKKNEKDVEALKKKTPQENMGGEISGRLALFGKVKTLSSKADLKIKDGHYRDYKFDQLKLKAELKEQKITLNNFELKKDRGQTKCVGFLDPGKEVRLNISSSQMPLDILRLAFKEDFKGDFNMNAAIWGNPANPLAKVDIFATDFELAEVAYDRFEATITKNEASIEIEKFNLGKGDKTTTVSGHISLGPKGKTSLKASIHNEGLGLMNLFTDEVAWRKGQTEGYLELEIIDGRSQLNGFVSVSDSLLYIKAIDGNIDEITGTASIKDNFVTVQQLTGMTAGQLAKGYPAWLAVTGSLDLGQAFKPDGKIDFDLSLNPTHLVLKIAKLYDGEMIINQASFKGPLSYSFDQGPTFKASVDIENAVIPLAFGQPNGEEKPFPLDLDIVANLNKNVYVVSGDIATIDLSNMLMNLDVKAKDLVIGGSVASPKMSGLITLTRGTISIFSREFNLLTPKDQEKYFAYDRERIKPNTALFTRDNPAPLFNVAAVVKVEEVDSFERSIKNVYIIALIKGRPPSKEDAGDMSVTFLAYDEDTSKSPPELVRAAYSDQEIKFMLLPDFVKVLAASGKDAGGEFDSNAAVAGYLNSRLQSYLFRGVERELESRLGLERLTLEYNFGNAIQQAMGGPSNNVSYQKPSFGVGFVKALFDRWYIDVRYSQGLEETTSAGDPKQFLNYEITYRLSPIWSISYYREPINYYFFDSDTYYKLTLRARFSFW